MLRKILEELTEIKKELHAIHDCLELEHNNKLHAENLIGTELNLEKFAQSLNSIDSSNFNTC